MTPYYQEPNQILYCGHILMVLKELPSESVDMVMTSPPYLGLRTYKTEPRIKENVEGNLPRRGFATFVVEKDYLIQYFVHAAIFKKEEVLNNIMIIIGKGA